ncbi:MAG: ATP-binding cassette domain-containing protein [Actinomycetota bacterium]|nr:ATP-binding cassette domain-containing protein [Actinomycetota bacterium]
MGAARVEISDFSWSFPGQLTPALQGITLSLEPGERVLLTGPSGSGKSTLAALLAGVLRDPDDGVASGKMLVSGNRPRGLVLQQPEDQTVMARVHDDVAFGLENALVEPAQMQELIDQALADVGLALAPDHPTRALSGGQRQRLALAGALAMEPGLLTLDEPTSALDPDGVTSVLSAVETLLERRGMTLLVIDHNPERWWGLVDRVVRCEAGVLVSDQAVTGKSPTRATLRAITPPPLGEPVVAVSELEVSRDGAVTHAGPLSFSVQAGEIVALRGANGSGKTTLAMTLAGVLPAFRGSVTIAGLNPHYLSSRDLATLVGVVPQNPAHSFFRATVRAELSAATGATQALRDASRWGLDQVLEAHPLSLSGGQQRRLALALATGGNPKVLILDEPSQSLDDEGLAELVTQLGEASEAGTAVILATHDDALVRALKAREVVLEPGAPPAVELPPTGVLATTNPLALVGAALLPAVALLSTIDVVSATVALVLMLACLPLAGRGIQGLGTRMLPVGLASVFSAVTIALYGQSSGEVFFQWGLVVVSEGSLDLALATALRILAIGGPAVVLFARVDATRFADALSQQARLPENFVVGGLSGLRLLEVVAGDREVRGWMMRARGMGDRSALRRVVAVALTIFVLAIRRSHTLAMAMEARAFGLQRTRTHYRTSVFPRRDYLWIVGGGLIGVLSVTAAVMTGSFNAILG